MSCRIPIVFGLFALLAAGAAPAAENAGAPPKRAVAAARLLVPLFEVDLAHPGGATTFFSVRNEIPASVDVRISLYAADSPQAPFHSDTVTLAAKQIRSVDVRSQPNLVADEDGFARGYVIIETLSGEAVIQGDYFQLNPGEAFATGSRLVNVDPQSEDNDLCSNFTIRFLNGGGFDGGTTFTIWLDLDVAPQDTTVLSYYVYRESGGDPIALHDLAANRVALRVSAAELMPIISTNFGAIEFQLADGVRGHIAAVMSALGLYSVGLEAACRD